MSLQRITDSASTVIADLSAGLGADWAINTDAFGLQKISKDESLFHGLFTYDISPKVWTYWVDGVLQHIPNVAGRAESKFGGGLFQNTSTQGSVTRVESIKAPRYQPSKGVIYSTSGAISQSTKLGHRRAFGMGTTENAVFFELAPDGATYAVVRRNHSQKYTTTALMSSFPLTKEIPVGAKALVRTKTSPAVIWTDVSTTVTAIDNTTNRVAVSPSIAVGVEVQIIIVWEERNDITENLIAEGLDISKNTLWDIQLGGGSANISFFVRSANASGVPLGVKVTYENLGINTEPSVPNPAIPAFFEIENVSATDSAEMLMGSTDISSENGVRRDGLSYDSVSNPNDPVITVQDTTNDEVFTLIVHNPQFIDGFINTREVHLLRASAFALDTCITNVYLTYAPTFVSGSLLLKENNSGSHLFYDNNLNASDTVARNAEIDTTGLKAVYRGRNAAKDGIQITKPADEIEFLIPRGAYLIITMQLAKDKVGTTTAGTALELGLGI